MKQSITFLSYSRRQLYFAESLALHLQNEGLDVWFDLQELQAGTVWQDGLDQGVGDAGQMVLVVSKESLESPYTQDEWKGFAAKGNLLVLAMLEPVELPDELLGLPTYDFRGAFGPKLRDLAGFLNGEAEPRHDRVPAANFLGLPGKLPGGLWVTLSGLYGIVIACALAISLELIFGSGESRALLDKAGSILVLLGVSFVIASWYAKPLLYRKLEYKKLKRGVLIAILLLVPGFFIAANFVEGVNDAGRVSWSLIAVVSVLLWPLFVYLFVLRRSAGLLRWMQPDEALQSMRRRVHLPLVKTASASLDAAVQPGNGVLTYAIHADPADTPLLRYVERTFKKEGHRRVAETASPKHHIAILSNRSSQAWVQNVTQAHAGNLVFIVASTIEFKESLTETGRYQWVDARNGQRQDIVSLARSLADAKGHKREAALEATPAMIDTWKVPDGITLLKRVLEAFAIFLLVFGLTDAIGFVMKLLGFPGVGDGNTQKSLVLVLLSAGYLWLASRALVYRKVAAPIFYGVLGGTFALVVWLQFWPTDKQWQAEDPTFWTTYWYVAPTIILVLAIYSALTSYFWLPASTRVHADEVGIKISIDRAFQRRNLKIVLAWVVAIVGTVVWMMINLEP